ncbi:PREDICTED: uncharacterized protein LOC106819087 [Priapulus caudatus]|uniref:Uncharacterized protein LOC106819087 n=1 Tax=Priapulus caudatus TaxID=37621 RepID=A0ABM1F462_PRICU|nr:PREDICTED: uncharacterized protein LOC106819087 [Priapulus caudatus]
MMHLHHHLADQVLKYGNLYVTHSFGMERFIQEIKRICTSRRKVEKAIMNKYQFFNVYGMVRHNGIGHLPEPLRDLAVTEERIENYLQALYSENADNHDEDGSMNASMSYMDFMERAEGAPLRNISALHGRSRAIQADDSLHGKLDEFVQNYVERAGALVEAYEAQRFPATIRGEWEPPCHLRIPHYEDILRGPPREVTEFARAVIPHPDEQRLYKFCSYSLDGHHCGSYVQMEFSEAEHGPAAPNMINVGGEIKYTYIGQIQRFVSMTFIEKTFEVAEVTFHQRPSQDEETRQWLAPLAVTPSILVLVEHLRGTQVWVAQDEYGVWSLAKV